MQVTIRPAEARDVPRMLELVKELALFEKAPEAVTVTEEEMRDAGFGPNPVWLGWVAESPGGDPGHEQRTRENHILGMAICYTRYSTWKGRVLYLEDIIVTEGARGQRIGEKLFLQCARHAVEQKFHGMRWQVLDWNTDAIRFYEKLGAEVSTGWLNGDLSQEQMRALVGCGDIQR